MVKSAVLDDTHCMIRPSVILTTMLSDHYTTSTGVVGSGILGYLALFNIVSLVVESILCNHEHFIEICMRIRDSSITTGFEKQIASTLFYKYRCSIEV